VRGLALTPALAAGACARAGQVRALLRVSSRRLGGRPLGGLPARARRLLDFIRAERVTVLGADIHAAVDIDLGSGLVRLAG
jgi:hypothetical protein